jgi:hypothetical protein
LINGTEIISNPQNVSDMLKSSCVRIIGELLNQNGCHVNVRISQQRTNFCPNNIFIFPVTENEVECVTRSLKGKFSAGFVEIPEYLVKQCIENIKKALAHIYNACFKSGVIPDRLKIGKVKLLYKKGDIYCVQTYRTLKIWISLINQN